MKFKGFRNSRVNVKSKIKSVIHTLKDWGSFVDLSRYSHRCSTGSTIYSVVPDIQWCDLYYLLQFSIGGEELLVDSTYYYYY